MRGLFLARLGNDVKKNQYMRWLIPAHVPKEITFSELGRTEQEKVRVLMSQSIDQKLDSSSTFLWSFTNEVGCVLLVSAPVFINSGTRFLDQERTFIGDRCSCGA